MQKSSQQTSDNFQPIPYTPKPIKSNTRSRSQTRTKSVSELSLQQSDMNNYYPSNPTPQSQSINKLLQYSKNQSQSVQSIETPINYEYLEQIIPPDLKRKGLTPEMVNINPYIKRDLEQRYREAINRQKKS